jgi:hypothetical protein
LTKPFAIIIFEELLNKDMANLSYNETLKARLTQIESEAEKLRELIAINEGSEVPASNGSTNTERIAKSTQPQANSIAGRVINVAIDLIDGKNRQVTNKDILFELEERGVRLGDTKNKTAMLAAILSAEVKKKNGRLKKVGRGVFDKK